MHLKSKFESTLEAIRKNEQLFADRVKGGSEDPNDYLNMAYLSGLHNGFNLVWSALDGMSEEEYDEAVLEILRKEVVN